MITAAIAAYRWFWHKPERLAFVDESAIDSTTDAKGNFSILFIDDETQFKVVDILRDAGWQKTRIVKDISRLDDAVLTEADLVFVDIQGVGKELGFKEGGLGLTKAIKERHPDKYVVIYSAETRGNRFHDALKAADDFLAKNADPYEFQKLVEDFFERSRTE